MANISAVVLAKDEEVNILPCLSHLKFCDEIIVIDDNSIDKTPQIARKFGAKVYSRTLNNDFAEQRNFGQDKAKCDWVLFIDADEIVTKKLASEIKILIQKSSFDGYLIRRQDIWLGKTLHGGEFGQVCLLRLAKRKSGKWIRSVHEHWLIDGKVGKLKNSLLHSPHPSVRNFLEHINFHSSLHAVENLKEDKKATFINIVVYPVGKFIDNFVVKKGYKDGGHGFVAAMLMSFHSFLAWSTLWTKKQTNQF